MKKENWIWMPHAGHLIVGSYCQFKLNTYVGGYIVSTVGEYKSSRSKEGDDFETIGCDRIYETMVFRAVKSENECCPYEMESPGEIDFAGYNDAEKAMKGHYKFCKKWAKRK